MRIVKTSIWLWTVYGVAVSLEGAAAAAGKNRNHVAFSRQSLTMMKVRGGSDIPADIPSFDPNAASMMAPSGGVDDVSSAAPVEMSASMESAVEGGTEESSTNTEVAETTAPSTSDMQSEGSAKWNNFVKRTGPAVLLLAVMYGVFAKMGTEALVWLVPLIQIGMYTEVHNVMNISCKSKWFLLIPYLLQTNSFLPTKIPQTLLNLSSFLLYASGLLFSIIQLNSHENLTPQVIQSFLQQHITSIATLVVILSPCLFWIKTARDFGLIWVLYPALLVIINDTMAYVFGVLLGKMPLLRVLSPKKTIEGFVGAAISTIGLSMPIWNLLQKTNNESGNSSLLQMIMALYVSVMAPFGGFLASAIKRAHHQKDFGTLIPGHGGIVDRLDCQLMTAPFVYYYLQQTTTKAV